MSLLPILAVTAGSAVAVAAAGSSGRRAQAGTAVGVCALLVVLGMAVGLGTTPDGVPAPVPEGAGAFERLLRANDYARLAIVLWSATGLALVALSSLLRPFHGMLVAVLGSLAAGIVALGSGDLVVATAGGIASGLAGMVLLAGPAAAGPASGSARAHHPDPALVPAARELRTVIIGGIAVLAGALVAPAAGAALFATGSGPAGPDAVAAGPAAAVGLAALALAGGVALWTGAIPFHLRVSRLTDSVPPVALPLVLAWGVVPLAAAAVTVADRAVAPLALPLDGERALILGVAVLTLAGGALAAWIRDEVRHLVGYLVIADTGFILLGFAALDPGAWEASRIWLLVFATSKTALAAWLAVVEHRFDTRMLGDLRGWARRAPLLALGFVLTVLATFGLPGWVGWAARTDLPGLAAGGPPATLALLAGFLTLPVYLRVLMLGLERQGSRVASVAAERFIPTDKPSFLGQSPIEAARTLAMAFALGARRNATPLTSMVVVVLALLALLTAWGMVDLAGAAAQPAPVVSGPSAD